MKEQLLRYLRCPECHGRFTLADAVGLTEGFEIPEVMTGRLTCDGCGRGFDVRKGVPRLVDSALPSAVVTQQTASSFGFVWSVTPDGNHAAEDEHHFGKLETTLDLAPPTGVLLDAGCGEGIDVAQQAERSTCEVIGVELSDGGCDTTFRRIAGKPSAHVVQADLRRLPFADGTFDLAYSYGVLHHVADPPAAACEIARVMRDGGALAVYLYEDFGERALAWRLLLRAVNQLRHVTVRLPHRVLYALCQVGSPVLFLTLTVPSRLLSLVPALRNFASRVPYNFGTGPFSMAGDLYDRFSAPLEGRYSRDGAAALVESAGLRVTRVANNRGWMVAGVKTS